MLSHEELFSSILYIRQKEKLRGAKCQSKDEAGARGIFGGKLVTILEA